MKKPRSMRLRLQIESCSFWRAISVELRTTRRLNESIVREIGKIIFGRFLIRATDW
jgi:hypothetical protein